MTDLSATVGARIRQRREDLGLSQARLAREAGLSVSFLSDVENGKRGMGVESLLAVAKVLGRKLDWFVKDEPDRYGRCPHCGARCKRRERRLNGNDTCEAGHVYPSKSAVHEKGK